MIQIRRGKSNSWQKAKPLADGQPGYDKDRHKLKIGDGIHSWDELPDASGLTLDEILVSEEKAKQKLKMNAVLNPLGTLVSKLLKLDSRPVITYGTEVPNEETVGQLYLQHYNTEPETDYIVEQGVSDIWNYKKYRSGFVECVGTYELSTTITEPIGSLFGSILSKNFNYPFTFKKPPVENVTVVSPAGLTWLASSGANTETYSSNYTLISPDTQSTNATYKIHLYVAGFLK